ncbi:MAG TPA: hypothetical protein DCZ72_14680 [Armatimonadetes bacterium]|nr:hypothetical protein [Armatimonadota bacterium]
MKRRVLAGLVGLLLAGVVQASTTYIVYYVQPGDSLESVAAAAGSTVAELRALNPTVREPLPRYEVLTVPLREGATIAVAAPEAPAALHAPPTPAAASATDTPAGGANGVAIGGQSVNSVAVGGASLGSRTPGLNQPQAGLQPAAEQASRLNYAVNGALGRLGQVANKTIGILRERRANAAKLFSVNAGTNLIITQLHDGWYGIRMMDGSTGWAPVSEITLTDTELVPSADAPAASTVGHDIIASAYKYLGVRYVWGGTSATGLDCSGFVQRVYRTHGYKLPRTAAQQAKVGQAIQLAELQPGDRVYFSSGRRYIDHTGMYIGAGQFIHASGGRRQVCIDNLFSTTWMKIYEGARR